MISGMRLRRPHLDVCLLVYCIMHQCLCSTAYSSFLGNWKEDLYNIGDGFLALLKTAGNVGAIISDAVEEDCEYTCPRGTVLVGRTAHVPTSNGCGSYGLQV